MSTFNINKACVINNFFGRSGGDGGYDSNCEEEVAEGGCAAWQGVGVDCDPDPCV